ncbi:46 kDa FK506-binding nuclear protein [Holothuria leucospilota]|uniref:46 kDa FK506-binding nuclear protein n=1 Tax=Holothuria leucospilota TaxID=206669 RepID=A0A9Q1BRG5_HOLLE|nr:46 kDa FK506-binding nuclear protein [Holothuria leucospilota]
MIWGITLEPGQAHTEVIEDEVHLSMATMESRGCIGSKADNFSHVVIKTGTTEYLLCTLVNGITYQQCLDLKLMPSDKVTFSVQGTNVVYLTGYSFASSETDQEITQTEDWIEDPVLEEGIPQDSVEYSEGDSSFQPPVGHDVIQGQQQNTADEEDQEQFSLQYEVPATEQQYQYTPERGHQQITQGAPSSSHQRQLQQHPSHDTGTGESNLDIKEEIHTVVDTDEDVPTDQANEGISSQSIHQPSTSAGQNASRGLGSSSLSHSSLTNSCMASDFWKVNDGEGRNNEASDVSNTSLSSYTRGKPKDRLRESSSLDTAANLVPSISSTPSQRKLFRGTDGNLNALSLPLNCVNEFGHLEIWGWECLPKTPQDLGISK